MQTNAPAPASSRAAGRTYNETARAASFCVQEALTEVARRQFLLLSARGEVFIEQELENMQGGRLDEPPSD